MYSGLRTETSGIKQGDRDCCVHCIMRGIFMNVDNASSIPHRLASGYAASNHFLL